MHKKYAQYYYSREIGFVNLAREAPAHRGAPVPKRSWPWGSSADLIYQDPEDQRSCLRGPKQQPVRVSDLGRKEGGRDTGVAYIETAEEKRGGRFMTITPH